MQKKGDPGELHCDRGHGFIFSFSAKFGNLWIFLSTPREIKKQVVDNHVFGQPTSHHQYEVEVILKTVNEGHK